MPSCVGLYVLLCWAAVMAVTWEIAVIFVAISGRRRRRLASPAPSRLIWHTVYRPRR